MRSRRGGRACVEDFCGTHFLLQGKGLFIGLVRGFELEVGAMDQAQLEPDLRQALLILHALQQFGGALVEADRLAVLIRQAGPVARLDQVFHRLAVLPGGFEMVRQQTQVLFFPVRKELFERLAHPPVGIPAGAPAGASCRRLPGSASA